MEQHRWQDIPGNDRDIQPLYAEWVRDAAPGSTIVELGVWHGRSLAFLAVEAMNADKELRVIGVDLWDNAGPIVTTASHPYQPAPLATVKEALKGLDVRLLQADTADAAAIIAGAEYVFVDADHSYDGVKRDLEAWKDRCTVEMAGHDHSWEYPGVEKAVREVLGDDYKTQGIVWRKSCR